MLQSALVEISGAKFALMEKAVGNVRTDGCFVEANWKNQPKKTVKKRVSTEKHHKIEDERPFRVLFNLYVFKYFDENQLVRNGIEFWSPSFVQ